MAFSDSQIGALIDRTLAVGLPLWTRIVWQGREGSDPLLTQVRVNGDGTVITEFTKLASFQELGLPSLESWKSL